LFNTNLEDLINLRKPFCFSSVQKSADSCEHGNRTSGFIKGGEFLRQLSDYYLPKKNSVAWS